MSCSISMPTFQNRSNPHAIMRYRERVDDQKSDKGDNQTVNRSCKIRYGCTYKKDTGVTRNTY